MVRVKNTSAILSLAGAISIIAVPVRADEPPQATAPAPAPQVAAPVDASVEVPAPAVPAQSKDQGVTETLGQVVVTAQKHEQKLQDVPIAVTAFTSRQLETRGIKDIADLSALAPGLQVEQSPANGSISQVAIRGNVQINPAIYWDTAVGVYMDGVYLGKSQGSVFDVVNLERVEILRGPQGTLYGRNTIGGAINLVTRKPSGVFDGDASVSFGNYGAQVEKLSLDLPKFGIASISLGAISDRRDGWVTTTPGSSTDQLNDRGNTGIQLAANLALAKGLQADYRYDHTDINENGEFGQLYRADSSFFGTFAGLPAPFGGFANLPSYASQSRQTVASVDAPSFEHVRVEGHSLTLTWDADARNTAKAITAYRHLDNQDSSDYDGSPLAVAQTQRFTKYHQFSQELQWVGRTDRLNYVAGLYYFHDDGRTNNPQSFFAGGSTYDSQYSTRTDAWAPYGQVDFHVTDALTLTGGLRYSEEFKALDRVFGCSAGAGPRCTPAAGETYDYLIPPGTHANGRFEALTPTATIAYRINNSLNTYFRYAEGFKSGGFNGEYSNTYPVAPPGDPNDNINETLTPFKPEKQRTFELGAKSSYYGGKAELNVALFQNSIKNLQESIFTASGAAASVIRNAGAAIVRGAEIEGGVTPVKGTRISGNYAYLEAYYKTFVDSGQNVPDNRAFVHAPRNTFNLLIDSKFLRTRWGTLEGQADYAYTASYYLYPYQLTNTDPSKQLASNTEVKSYGLLNLRLALTQVPLGTAASGELALWARNVTNEAVATNMIDFGPGFGSLTEAYFNDPRTFGITGTVHF